jgi:dGTPase
MLVISEQKNTKKMSGARSNKQVNGLQSTRKREDLLLAPYAFFSHQSQGRKYAEPEHPYRGPFQRDRDRILHSAAFRRLSGKMQVFTGELGDYHRTRLTHTMEVASIARTMGRALQLNEDLIEALALLHDIGHPPFGHAGEDALDECLAEAGGFSHNAFALVLVEQLERRYQQFPGLNLSHEVLLGQQDRIDKQSGPRPLLEVQVVDAADSCTYNAHDVDDAIKLQLVEVEEFEDVPLAADALVRVKSRWTDLDPQTLRQELVRELIDTQVTSTLRAAVKFLSTCGWNSFADALGNECLVRPGDEIKEKKIGLEAFLYQRVYRHERLMEERRVAQRNLQDLCTLFAERPDRMPAQFQHRAQQVGALRSACDYLAGMTERFFQQEYDRHLG